MQAERQVVTVEEEGEAIRALGSPDVAGPEAEERLDTPDGDGSGNNTLVAIT
jgi:hypothetical protein